MGGQISTLIANRKRSVRIFFQRRIVTIGVSIISCIGSIYATSIKSENIVCTHSLFQDNKHPAAEGFRLFSGGKGRLKHFQNTIGAGIAADIVNGDMGFDVSVEPIIKVSRNLGFGMHFDYTTLSLYSLAFEDGSVHIFKLNFVPKLYAPFSRRLIGFVDLGPGFTIMSLSVRNRTDAQTEFETCFSLTAKAGLQIRRFHFGLKFDTYFFDENMAATAAVQIGIITSSLMR